MRVYDKGTGKTVTFTRDHWSVLETVRRHTLIRDLRIAEDHVATYTTWSTTHRTWWRRWFCGIGINLLVLVWDDRLWIRFAAGVAAFYCLWQFVERFHSYVHDATMGHRHDVRAQEIRAELAEMHGPPGAN